MDTESDFVIDLTSEATSLIFFCLLVVCCVIIHKKRQAGNNQGHHQSLRVSPFYYVPDSRGFYTFTRERVAEYGKFFKMRVGPFFSLIVISDKDIAQSIYKDDQNFDTPDYASRAFDFFPKALPAIPKREEFGEWHKHRKAIAEGLSSKCISNMMQAWGHHIREFIEKLYRHVAIDAGASFAIMKDIHMLVMENIVSSAFGFDIGPEERARLRRNIDIVFKVISARLTYDPVLPRCIPWNKIIPAFKEPVEAMKEVREIGMKMIKKRLGRPQELGAASIQQDHKDMLDILLAQKAGLTTDEVIDDIIGLVFAASDSIANTVSSVFYFLAKYPHIQDKVRKEIQEVLYEGREAVVGEVITPTDDHIRKLTYLTQVIKETLRLFPTVGVNARQAIKDVQVNGYSFPKGTYFLIATSMIHRQEEHWPNPLKFDPDRFANNLLLNSTAEYGYTWLPFGDGRRNCVGKDLAMYEMLTIVSMVLQEFSLELDVEKQAKMRTLEVVSTRFEDVHVKLTPVKHQIAEI